MPPRNHYPKRCGSCYALIFWAQLVDEEGEILRKENGRPRVMPVNAEPVENGNVVLSDREGKVVARVLRAGEAPPLGGKRRVSHFSTCPQAENHRKRGRRCLIL